MVVDLELHHPLAEKCHVGGSEVELGLSSYVRISFLYPNYHPWHLYVLREEMNGLKARVVREFESIGNK